MNIKDVTKEYKKDDLTIVWQPKKCIHSEKCWRGLPEVFQYGKKPWVNPDGADKETIMARIEQCPSGALSYKLEGEISNQEDITSIDVIPNGPLLLKGHVEIKLADGSVKEEKNTALCRCGASSNKPYCDGSHKQINFEG